MLASQTTASIALPKAKILLVEDSFAEAYRLQAVLSHYDVHHVSTGEAALDFAKDWHPDLLLLDVVLPGCNGHTVCQRWMNDPATRDVPVIFLTGQQSEADELEGLSLGAVDYLTKPFHPAIVKKRIATHLELKRTRDLLALEARTDPLTGLMNRRGLQEKIEYLWSHATREGFSVSLLAVDLDNMKNYNDVLGHDAGDAMLVTVAQALSSVTYRATDVWARLGGDEFVLFSPYTDEEGALVLAQRIVAAVEGCALSANGVPITASVGAASVEPLAGWVWQDLAKKADQALYRAKGSGKNTVHQ